MPLRTNNPRDFQKVADAFNASADIVGYEKWKREWLLVNIILALRALLLVEPGRLRWAA